MKCATALGPADRSRIAAGFPLWGYYGSLSLSSVRGVTPSIGHTILTVMIGPDPETLGHELMGSAGVLSVYVDFSFFEIIFWSIIPLFFWVFFF